MKRLSFLLALLCTSVFFFQCQKGLDFSAEKKNGAVTNATVQGNIFDENGKPALNVSVKAGGKAAITDARGYFRIINASFDKDAALVIADKPGYFKAYRTFTATSGANQVVIRLIKKSSAGIIKASSGGEVTLGSGAKVVLPANGVVLASGGAAYSGDIFVYASYIDPSSSTISQTVPGSFVADDKNNKRVTLNSYGMMAVELESASGQKLQVKNGNVATLTSPIPSSLQSSAPATISLWYVDENTGVWKEEGIATKNGNTYVGEVKHFSFWNCDVSASTIKLSMLVKGPHGDPLVHVQVALTRAGWNTTYGWTDSLGQVSGYVPSNEALALNILGSCNNSIYTQNVGPFTQNTDLGTITVNNSTAGLVTVKGKIVNCAGTPVKGQAIIQMDNYVRYSSTDANGNFSTTFTVCGNSSLPAQVSGLDVNAQQEGNPVSVNLVFPVTEAGNIVACGTSVQQYINYTIDDTAHAISSPVDSLMHYQDSLQIGGSFGTVLWGYQMQGSDQITFDFHGTAPGNYPLTNLRARYYDQFNTLVQPFNVNISKYPQAIGQFYEGSFTGQFKDQNNITHRISCTFRIRRVR